MKSMIKITVFILALIIHQNMAYAQVGINTENPQQLFSIDGKSSLETTNPQTGVPSTEQQKDDFVVNSNGNVGIGTIYPNAKIDIKTNIKDFYGFRLVDGNEGDNKVLVSDDNGYGTWTSLEIPVYHLNLRNLPDYKHPTKLGKIAYTGLSINLAPGEWLISFSIGLELTPITEPTNSYIGTNMIRIRLLDTDNPSNTSYLANNTVNQGTDLYPRLSSTGFSTTMTQGVFNGSLAVENKTDTNKTYYLFVDNAATSFENSFTFKFNWNESYATFMRIESM